MFTITKSFEFCAAHHNPNDDGPCSKNHGHNWEAQFFIQGTTLDHRGWLISFDEIRNAIKPTIQSLDHQDLNVVLDFNPSSELLAQHLWVVANNLLKLPDGVVLREVRVTERAGDWKTFAAYSHE